MERRPPAFQFFAEDFLTGVMSMSDRERGVYITLLALSWSRGGPITDTVERLAMACASTPEAVQDVLDLKFANDGSGWRNKRLEQTRIEQAANRDKRAEAGKIGAAARWNGNAIASASDCHSDANATVMANDGSSTSTSSSKKKIDSIDVDQISFAASRRAEAICKDIGRPKSADKRFAWKVAVLVSAGIYSEHWLCDSVQAVKQGDRKSNPWGYFTTALRNLAKELGRDFDADLKLVPARRKA